MQDCLSRFVPSWRISTPPRPQSRPKLDHHPPIPDCLPAASQHALREMLCCSAASGSIALVHCLYPAASILFLSSTLLHPAKLAHDVLSPHLSLRIAMTLQLPQPGAKRIPHLIQPHSRRKQGCRRQTIPKPSNTSPQSPRRDCGHPLLLVLLVEM